MRKPISLLLSISFVALVVAVTACSSKKRGESCDELGRTADCDDGLLCVHETDTNVGNLVCLPTCVGQEDCATGEQCSDDGTGIPRVCRTPAK